MASTTFNLDFDTPKTASGVNVHVTGTVPAANSWDAAGQVTVTRASGSVQYFSFTKKYTATDVDLPVDETVVLAIVPALSGADAATTFTKSGSLEATII